VHLEHHAERQGDEPEIERCRRCQADLWTTHEELVDESRRHEARNELAEQRADHQPRGHDQQDEPQATMAPRHQLTMRGSASVTTRVSVATASRMKRGSAKEC